MQALRAHTNFVSFLKLVRIQEPPDPQRPDSGGIIPFELWPHILSFADTLQHSKLISVLKARQVGATWTVAAYVCWLMNVRPGSDWLLLSRSEIDAGDFLNKLKTVHDLLPTSVAQPVAKSTTLSLTLSNGSRATAMASTEDAGRGHTYSGIAQDEADFHPYLERNYLAVKPTIDSGGQLIQLSTVNKRQMLSLFKELYRGAPDNGWAKLFLPYSARPGRDEAWYERTKRSAPNTQELSPELYMEQEYPANEEEALSPSRALGYFDGDAVREMLQNDCRAPLTVQLGMTSIWQKPAVAGRYVIGVDSAWGTTGSYSCAAVMDWSTGTQVAEMHGRPHPDEVAQEVMRLHLAYNHAYMGVEIAGEGQERDGESVVVVNKILPLLAECGCKNKLFYADHMSSKPSKPGWQTDGKTRPVMLEGLAEAVRNREIVIRSSAGMGEMMSFIRNEKGRPQHVEGAHDDRVMAYAIAWQMRKYARFRSGTAGPVYIGRRW